MLANMMDKYPIIIYIGAGVLGRVGGEMIVTDPWVERSFGWPHWVVYASEALFVAVVVGMGWVLMKRKRARR
jgi:predicted tellurium resistance membrane protein TerC